MSRTRTITSLARPPGYGIPVAVGARLQALQGALGDAFALEQAWRRPFLWLPVAAGAGAIVNLMADRDPPLAASLAACIVFAAAAMILRTRPLARALALAIAFFAAGHASMGFRIARVAAPVIQRLTIANVTGFVEQVDHRREGARIVMRLTSAEGIAPENLPKRVRLTTRRDPGVAAGAHVATKARLLPPARAALPGGYDFARDAYFAGIGGVGNVLGKIETRPVEQPATLSLRFAAAIDHMRNALSERIAARLPGDTGAIAVAMVTGKRDLLAADTKELIREAGIFHIITISGIQMTLVAGIFFVLMRRLFALSRTLALNYPIKKWAAACAIAGAIGYDILTGSRVGTERALVMTTILLAAVIADRPSLSMRNLAMAVLFVVAFEPEALLGASFQLSFAAVAALIAVWEARNARYHSDEAEMPVRPPPQPRWFVATRAALGRFAHGKIGSMLLATVCATAATASFMAYNFHELSPYVLIGNPMTMAMIEFFAVPAALLGTLLYPFGLDGPVWAWLGLGIDLVLRVARWIAAAPGATVHLPAFDSTAVLFLTLAVLSAVIWRTPLLRATAIPFAVVGVTFAINGPKFDVAIAATGEAAAVRGEDGALVLLGRRGGAHFAAEQWLRADADSRRPATMKTGPCDKDGCVAHLADGRAVALVTSERAFLEDCDRAWLVVTPLYAPTGCAAALVVDRRRLASSGAITLDLRGEDVREKHARSADEDRPWSRAPRKQFRRPGHATPPDEETLRQSETRALSERID